MKTIFTLLFVFIIGTAMSQVRTYTNDYHHRSVTIDKNNPKYSWNREEISVIPTAPPPPPTPIPIDGGVGFLLVAGAGFGLRKLRNNKITKEEL